MAVEVTTPQDLDRLKQELIQAFTQLLESRVIRELKNRTPPSPTEEHKEWLRSADVRKMLGISTGTLKLWRIGGHLPFSRVGRTYLYAYEEVLRVLEENKSNI